MDINIEDIQRRFNVVGRDPAIKQAINVAMQVAPTNMSVLILGESGTGKDVFPQIIHANSARKHGRYIAVNCGAIPEGTIDSELFGHVKGSFTGAVTERKGYFEEADGGTIFLDEIGELPETVQAKLLRVLESGEFLRVGSSIAQKVNVRVIAATNVNLERAIANKKFRADLYFRLSGVVIRIPSLRDRKGDIPELFKLFSNKFAADNNMPALTLTPKAIERLMAYRWPGNVRQLKNIAEKLTVLSPERELDAETIGPYMPQENTDGSLLVLNNEGSSESFNNEREILYKILFGLREDVRYIKSTVNELLRRSVRMESADFMHNVKYQLERRPANDYYDTLDEPENYQTSFVEDDFEELSANKDKHSFEDLTSTTEPENDEDTEMENLSIVANERQLIVRVLNKCGGRRKDAAKILGISERTLIRKMSDYNLK